MKRQYNEKNIAFYQQGTDISFSNVRMTHEEYDYFSRRIYYGNRAHPTTCIAACVLVFLFPAILSLLYLQKPYNYLLFAVLFVSFVLGVYGSLQMRKNVLILKNIFENPNTCQGLKTVVMDSSRIAVHAHYSDNGNTNELLIDNGAVVLDSLFPSQKAAGILSASKRVQLYYYRLNQPDRLVLMHMNQYI